MVYVLLGKGFEEMEATAPVDVMRRAGIEVKTVGIGAIEVEGAHGMVLRADCTLESVCPDCADMVVLPGGMGGVESIMASDAAMELIKNAYEKGKTVAAICAAPMILGKLGIIEGKRAVIYPGMESELLGAEAVKGVKTCVDGRVITGQGPGAAFDFGLELVKYLAGEEKSRLVREAIHY